MTEPKPVDCQGVLAHLYAFHDHELSAAEADQIREHLMACEPCLDAFQVEDAMRALIRKCCSQERAPQSLRVRVEASFTRRAEIVETTLPETD